MQWAEVCNATTEKGLKERKANSVILLEQIIPGLLLCASHSTWLRRRGENKAGPCPQEDFNNVLGETWELGGLGSLGEGLGRKCKTIKEVFQNEVAP